MKRLSKLQTEQLVDIHLEEEVSIEKEAEDQVVAVILAKEIHTVAHPDIMKVTEGDGENT